MPYKDSKAQKEYSRKYYQKNRDKIINRVKERSASRKGEKATYDKEYIVKNREKIRVNRQNYRLHNAKVIAERNKEWQKTDVCKDYRKAYYKQNKERILKKNKSYFENHKEEKIAYDRDYYLKNKDRFAEKRKAWFATPKGKLCKKVSSANRRARKKNSKGTVTKEDIKELYSIQGARCYYCSISLKELYHIDHMLPLIRGGEHNRSNICLSCATCNMRKHTKTVEEFQRANQERGNVCYQK